MAVASCRFGSELEPDNPLFRTNLARLEQAAGSERVPNESGADSKRCMRFASQGASLARDPEGTRDLVGDP